MLIYFLVLGTREIDPISNTSNNFILSIGSITMPLDITSGYIQYAPIASQGQPATSFHCIECVLPPTDKITN